MSNPLTEQVPNGWSPLLEELDRRSQAASEMGGAARLARQADKGRLNARQRVAQLSDYRSFSEYGALGAGQHPGGDEAVPADGIVGGVARINGRPVCILAEDFSVQGGSIGHVNAAKRLRIVMLAQRERLPLVLMLDGAGERTSNAFERYPVAPNDLQALADLSGQVPIVTLVLGTSAGHGAICGLFGDFRIMTKGAALFAAGPPLVRASLGMDVSVEELGGSDIHVRESGVIHQEADSEEQAFKFTREFLGYLPQSANDQPPVASAGPESSTLGDLLEVFPANLRQAYDIRKVLEATCDADSILELQPSFGMSMVTALCRFGGHPVLVVANQPNVFAGAITVEAAEKAAHFLQVAGAFGLSVVFLADNPGVMPGPDAERAGTLRSAAKMYAAQRAIRAPKIHVTLRKAFGFGSSLMAMNPFDQQTLTIAFPGITLGGVPAVGGAEASGATQQESERMKALQSGAWTAADNASYDKVIDPRDLRSEIIRGLELRG